MEELAHGLGVTSRNTSRGGLNGTGRKPGILVVDDEPSIRRFCRAAAVHRGYWAHTVSSAEECVEYLESGGRDIGLIFLDVHLPCKSGLDILGEIRTLCPSVTVVMMSGLGDEGVQFAAQRGDIAGFMPKPFALSDVARYIESSLAQSSSTAI